MSVPYTSVLPDEVTPRSRATSFAVKADRIAVSACCWDSLSAGPLRPKASAAGKPASRSYSAKSPFFTNCFSASDEQPLK